MYSINRAEARGSLKNWTRVNHRLEREAGVKMGRIISLSMLLIAMCFVFVLPGHALAADNGNCPRPDPGTEVLPPPDLYSANGALNVTLSYLTDVDSYGRTLFCFVTTDGLESPTLHVNPGDTINITLTNALPPVHGGPAETVSRPGDICGDSTMLLTSTNMHFHGTNTSPQCHSDEVIRTLVNPGETFTYTVKIPSDEPPGLYWYHPHVHGISSKAVQGGSAGAIIVEGIEKIQPAVAGLPHRLLILRDLPLQSPVSNGLGLGKAPFWDSSINYVAVPFPHYPPAIIKMQTGTKEFWRVANASADSIFDIQVMYDGVAQPLQIVAFDGVPTGSQDGKRQGKLIKQNEILIPTAGRVEFIVNAPKSDVKSAMLITNAIDSGPAGDNLPARPFASIVPTNAPVALPKIPQPNGAPNPQRFEGLQDAKVTAERKLYFSEVNCHFAAKADGAPPPDSDKNICFFITVDGQQPMLYDPNNPPAIVTTKGAVEDWTIENRSTEVHEFHIHQIHFLLEEVNGVPVPKKQQQFYDTHQVGYWDGESETFPSIKVRMDFRGDVVGNFVYHCHILDHEDGGMMAIIQVNPK